MCIFLPARSRVGTYIRPYNYIKLNLKKIYCFKPNLHHVKYILNG